MTTSYPFAQPLYVMLKPTGARCNLSCSYCYYRANKHETFVSDGVMSIGMLEKFIRDYLSAQTRREVFFIWHGGEPLLCSLDFYRKAIEFQKHYGSGMIIENCIQTNGILLNEEWCEFFRDNKFLVGISIDGPQFMHDYYRRGKNGNASFDKVMKGLTLLQRYGIEWNAMATVNHFNADYPEQFYQFFRSIGCKYLQFTPVVERCAVNGNVKGKVTEESVTPVQWGNFLCQLFDEWVKADVGLMSIQLFEATLANWLGLTPGLCMLSRYCGHAGVIETNGDVYSCDHFAFPSYRLGNLNHQTLTSMMYSEQQHTFAKRKLVSLPKQCNECKFLFTCYGECPKNRFINDEHGQPALNYLCEGYRQYFAHVAPFMQHMAKELKNKINRSKYE